MTLDTIEELLADLDISDDRFAHIQAARSKQETFEALLNTNPNAIVLVETVTYARLLDNDTGTRRSKAFINLLKLLLVEFLEDPYWNSRIAWLMWFWVCYARYDSYYPMKWCFHYDPKNWYRTGEPLRPAGLEKTLPDDPFNIKGQCFIHPEWYKQKETQPDGTPGSVQE
jgi:hypothetical protein